MDRFEIEGGKSLSGCVSISGSKNATLPLMAAALLSSETTVIENVPDLQDIYTMSMVLRVIGAQVKVEDGRMEIDAQNCNFWEAPYELVRKMRA
jgi:UDP-N-acetylglucosamine 1-carboxyvinyltransferase